MTAPRRSSRVGAGAVVTVAIVLGLLVLISRSNEMKPAHRTGSGCLVRARGFNLPLSTDQAAIAATIAGVASDHAMPVRALTIAYATALQESDLEDLPYGDRDSVGVFQQRPSQGWGTRRQLLDPVYATTKFFAVLATVPDYQRLPVYRAAQDVQRSADGYAYSQYSAQGAAMASGFAGWRGRSIWCWYGSGISGSAKLAAASRSLVTAFGPLRTGRYGDPIATVRVPDHAAGWAVAFWLVTHASEYGLRTVRFAGYQWTAATGRHGWVKDPGNHRWPSARLTVAFGRYPAGRPAPRHDHRR